MRRRGVGPPPSATKDLATSCPGEGNKIRCDSEYQPFPTPPAAQGDGAVHDGAPKSSLSDVSARGIHFQQAAFNRLKKDQPRRNHLPVPVIVTGAGRNCKYDKCPGFKTTKKLKRPYQTKYKCEQCSMEKGVDFWLCHTTKKIDEVQTVINCHTKYHVDNNLFVGTECTECSVISDLTEDS